MYYSMHTPVFTYMRLKLVEKKIKHIYGLKKKLFMYILFTNFKKICIYLLKRHIFMLNKKFGNKLKIYISLCVHGNASIFKMWK